MDWVSGSNSFFPNVAAVGPGDLGFIGRTNEFKLLTGSLNGCSRIYPISSTSSNSLRFYSFLIEGPASVGNTRTSTKAVNLATKLSSKN